MAVTPTHPKVKLQDENGDQTGIEDNPLPVTAEDVFHQNEEIIRLLRLMLLVLAEGFSVSIEQFEDITP